MFYFNTLNLNQISGGNQVKQGDFGSTFTYKLADEKNQELDIFDQKTAYVNLVLNNNIVFTTTVIVEGSTVTFNIDKAIPTGLYYLEIKIDDYIFPSDKDSIILIEEGAVAYDLKDLVPNYDTNMTISGILSDLSQKGIDITGLRSKLDEVQLETTAQLAQKVDKGNVSVSDINKNLGKLDQTYMSDEFLQQMAGNAPINMVPADGSLTTAKYAESSVTANKVDFGFSFMPQIAKYERRSINGLGEYNNASTTTYASDFIPIQTHQSEVINNDSNYLYAVSLFNAENTQVFDSGFSASRINLNDLRIRYNTAVKFVIKIRNIAGSELDANLGSYFSSNIYITTDKYPLGQTGLSASQTQDWLRKFPEANFNTDVVGVDNNGNLTLVDNISTSEFHRWFLYYKTDLSREIQEVTAKLVVNNSQNQVNHRVFIESTDGKLVWFGYNHTGTVDCYTFNRFTNAFSLITHSNGSPTAVPYPSSNNDFRMTIRLNGTFAVVYIDDVEVVTYNLANYLGNKINKTGLAFRGNIEVRPTLKDFDVQYLPTPYVHMSFDDVFSILKDLTDNEASYTSVFDQPQFKILKNAYDIYGVKITLNLFYKLSTESFNLSQVTTKFKTEFSNNSHWLKFAYHATDETARPSTLSDTDLVTDVQAVYAAIERFAGQRSIDKVTRFGFFSVSKSGLKALRDRNLVLGALGADDTRADNSGLIGVGLYTLQNSDSYLDKENSIHYFKTEPRLDSVSDERIKEIIDTGLSNPNQNQVFILFSHHINDRILNTMASYSQSRGLRFDYPENNIH